MGRLALFAGLAVSLSAASAHADCPELLQNNELNDGIAPWNVVSTPQTTLLNVSVSNDQFRTLDVSIFDFSSATYVVELSQTVPVIAGESYNVSFYMDVGNAVQVRAFVGSATSPATPYGLDQTGGVSTPGSPGSATLHYTFVATATDANAKFVVSWLNSSAGIVVARFDSLFMERTSNCAGSPGTGGATGAGGATGTGGATGAGGAMGTGGATGAGGAIVIGVGGAPGSGGRTGGADGGSDGPTVSDGSAGHLGGTGAGGSGSGPTGDACTPGIQVACACAGGAASGVQVCNAQGTSFGQCTGCPGTAGTHSGGCSCAITTNDAAPGISAAMFVILSLLGWMWRRRKSGHTRLPFDG